MVEAARNLVELLIKLEEAASGLHSVYKHNFEEVFESARLRV